MEQVGEGAEGVVGVLGILHVVPPHDQQEHASDELQGVRHPVEVPDRRCGSKTQGHVEPQRQSVACVEERGVGVQ